MVDADTAVEPAGGSLLKQKRSGLPIGIVGFDPGTTSALAVVSLDRKVLLLGSWRNASLDMLSRKVADCTSAVIVACDVRPPSRAARRFSAAFGAVLFYDTASGKAQEFIRGMKSSKETKKTCK